MQRHPVCFKPLAVAVVVQGALFFRQLLKGQGGAVFQHMVAAVAVTVRQALDEGVAAGQFRQQGRGVASAGDGLGHFHGELVSHPQHGQKFLLNRRQRVDHGGGEQGGDVGIFARQRAPLRQRLQAQVNRRDPALGVVQKVLQLLFGEVGPAAAHVDGQVGLIQPKLLGRELVQPVPQTNALFLGENPVPAGHDQVYVARQVHGRAAQKLGRRAVVQQVKVVHKNVAFIRPGQLAAHIVQNQGGLGGVLRASVLVQNIQPGMGKGALDALPEKGQGIGVDIDAQDFCAGNFGTLVKKPADGGGFAVGHGGHNAGKGVLANALQLLLKRIGQVNGVWLF